MDVTHDPFIQIPGAGEDAPGDDAALNEETPCRGEEGCRKEEIIRGLLSDRAANAEAFVMCVEDVAWEPGISRARMHRWASRAR